MDGWNNKQRVRQFKSSGISNQSKLLPTVMVSFLTRAMSSIPAIKWRWKFITAAVLLALSQAQRRSRIWWCSFSVNAPVCMGSSTFSCLFTALINWFTNVDCVELPACKVPLHLCGVVWMKHDSVCFQCAINDCLFTG